MAPSDNTFEITPRTIDFGDRVVAVPQIAFAASRKGRPFKVLGIAMIATALAGIGYEAVLGSGLSTLKSGGSTRIWATFVLAGIGVFGLVYQRRALVIGLADGSKISLSGGGSAFQQRVVDCIGEAMRADGLAPYHVAVNMQSETIESTAEPSPLATPPQRPQAHVQTRPPLQATTSPAAMPRSMPQPGALPPGAHPIEGMPSTAHYRNGQHAPLDAFEARLNAGAGAVHRTGPSMNGPIEVPRTGETPAWPHASPTPARPAREPANPLRDLDALTHFVKQSDIQHKAALLDLLAVVADYLKGGGTIREDAVAHWQSFSGYVHQYLASVDGLVPLTDRAGRPFAIH